MFSLKDEESYDDLDFYDTVHTDDSNDEEDGMLLESDLELNDDSEEHELDYSSEKEVKNSDWELFGLNKKYKDKTFDIDKANRFLNDDPIESIRYAAYFAKRNNNDAKNFIIDIVQKSNAGIYPSEPGTIGDIAKTAFWLFFRNYVRTEIEKYYNKQGLTNTERMARTEDALQQCFTYVFENIDKYDPSIARINTFFSSMVMRGPIFEWESLRKGRNSKQTLRTDKMTVNAIKQCEDMGIKPNSAIIASITGKSFNEIQTARIRIKAENTMSTFDAPDLGNSGGTIVQTAFETPENKLIEEERTKELINKLDALTDEEKTLFLMTQGINCTGSEFYETDAMSPIDIEEQLGIDRGVVQQIVNRAIKKLKKSYNVKEKRGDALLSGRGLSFDEDDDDFLDDIIDVY